MPRRSGGRGCLIALGAVAAVLVLGVVVAAVLLALGARRLTDELDEIGRTRVEEARDVEVTECGTDDDGFMTATVDVTNQSSETSDYLINVSFDIEVGDGDEQLATASATVRSLAPGQQTEVEARSSEEAPGDVEFDCRRGFVDRRSTEG